MKSNRKTKIVILLLLGIFFAFLPVFTNNLRFTPIDRDISSNYNDEFDHNNIKISAVSAPIHIDDTNPSMNWSVAKEAEICTGSGTYSDPYIIEDLIIDGNGTGSCILIENSDVYFRIENCTVYNSGTSLNESYTYAGIALLYVKNAQLINNNCSSNFVGVYSIIRHWGNNTISGNIANNNNNYGIYAHGNNNTIAGNTANNNNYGILGAGYYNNITGNTANNNNYGIWVSGDYNNITGNTANNNGGIGIRLGFCLFNNLSGNTANSNGNTGISIYGFGNLVSGNTANNNGGSGIRLTFYSGSNTLSGNTASYNIEQGIELWLCTYNNITGNSVNYNTNFGIYLDESNYTIVSGNMLIGNGECIVEENCQGNTFSDNGDCIYGQGNGEQPIPGYNFFFFLGILSFVAILITKKLKKS